MIDNAEKLYFINRVVEIEWPVLLIERPVD